MYKLSKNIIILLCSITVLIFSASAQSNHSEALTIDTNEQSTIGLWVKDGAAIKEYPVCYQLWKCESGRPTMGEAITLPKGEWGLCENYTDKSSDNFCTQCNAPPPIEVCE